MLHGKEVPQSHEFGTLNILYPLTNSESTIAS